MLHLDKEITIRTSRIALSLILLFLITWYYSVPQYSWSLITAIIVLFDNSTLGGSLLKSKARFLGTTFSALYGLIIIYFCGNNSVINILAFIPGLFFYTYFFMSSENIYIGIIGTVTLTIVLFNYNDVDNALLRVFNIIIGTIGALIMMRFFYPQYSRDKMLVTDVKIIKQLIMILNDYLDETKPIESLKKDYLNHEHEIISLLNVVNRQTQETKAEAGKHRALVEHQVNSIQYMRHIFRMCSVFLFHLTTQDVRSTPFIQRELTKILFVLTEIQCMLNNEPMEQHQSSMQSRNEPAVHSSNEPEDIKAFEALLVILYEEVILLRKEVEQIHSIYGKITAHAY